MNKYIKLVSTILLSFTAFGCADYLDVVPDKTQDVSLLYSRKETAYRALATCYHYMPVYALIKSPIRLNKYFPFAH